MGGAEPSTSYDSKLSTSSSESMVQIKRTRVERAVEEEESNATHRLLYSKSKVYVNPTPYARDNIPGFVALVKKEGISPTYLLAWIPEGLLDEKGRDEWDKFMRVEKRPPIDEEEDAVFIDPPAISRPDYYAFSVSLSSIYSIIAQQPSLASWHGSITINLVGGSTLPTLHFHDDESRSVQLPSPSNQPGTYPPSYPPTGNKSNWGGESLISGLRPYANIVRSTLDPTLFLVDPSRQDIEAHSMVMFSDDAVDSILSRSSSSPIPVHRRPRPHSSPPAPLGTRHRTSVLHASLSTSPSSSSFLQSFSNITRATRHAAQQILSHPLAKPIVPHLPDPVRSLVSANGEWSSWVEKSGMGEFESARVYLARWARIVAEEGERSRLREALPSTSGTGESEDAETSSLGIFELIHSTSNLPIPRTTRNPRHPVDRAQWEAWFFRDGRPKVDLEHMRSEVFRRGLTHDVRRKAWPFILGVLDWDARTEQREVSWDQQRKLYHQIFDEWYGVEEVFNREDVVEERHRIDVDCRRTDRTQSLFAAQNEPRTPDAEDPHHKRTVTISPNEDDIGAQAPSNEHVERLSAILLTYNLYEKELGEPFVRGGSQRNTRDELADARGREGYVQGMSDLCAPIYIVMGGDEEMTFWCFVQVMNRMKQNFLRDQSGMKKQLLTLQQLLAVMDPELYRHLEKVDGLNLFFCFRWVLIAFKREFPFEDVLRLWEVLWTDYYSTQFVLFVALAVLESHRDVILRYLVEFDEILKYCNELSMTIELDSTLAQAEVLYLSFNQLVADIDRRQVEGAPDQIAGLRRRVGGQDSSSLNLPLISENLRELLDRGDR